MKNNFLHWLEVLSLTGHVDSAVSTLGTMMAHTMPELSLLIQDGMMFVKKFKVPIQSSPPHIYISALPQAPTTSLIRQQYLPRFFQLPCVKGGLARCFNGHTDTVLSVAYSADSESVVSGSEDKTIRVWAVSDGTVKFTFKGHTSWDTVAFSPTYPQIAAGTRWDNNLRLWTPGMTGSHQSYTLTNGGEVRARSVAFFPNGKQVMATSRDGTIRVWDGEELVEVGTSKLDGEGRWIFGKSGEYLFWTLFGIRHPRNTTIIGPYVDLSHSVDGEQWIDCKKI
ncbi:WD40-repeat-containing domain protein [Mycena leptocephala]|nr:WD40-repeat-containing domain protein [Mycena leptocephala]